MPELLLKANSRPNSILFLVCWNLRGLTRYAAVVFDVFSSRLSLV
jgi:hypothetical protein